MGHHRSYKVAVWTIDFSCFELKLRYKFIGGVVVRGVCPEGVLSGSFCPFSEEVAEQFCASHFNHKGFSLGEPDVGGGFSSQKEVPNHFQVASRDQPPTGTCHSVPLSATQCQSQLRDNWSPSTGCRWDLELELKTTTHAQCSCSTTCCEFQSALRSKWTSSIEVSMAVKYVRAYICNIIYTYTLFQDDCIGYYITWALRSKGSFEL